MDQEGYGREISKDQVALTSSMPHALCPEASAPCSSVTTCGVDYDKQLCQQSERVVIWGITGWHYYCERDAGKARTNRMYQGKSMVIRQNV